MSDRLTQLVVVMALVAVPAAAWAEPGEDQYAVAAGHYARSRWQLAVEEFSTFLESYPDHARTDQAIFFLAEALVQLNQYADAQKHFDDYLARQPEGRYARQASFRLGESAYLAGQLDEAGEALEQFRQRYADDPLDEYVLPYLGDIALHAREFELAVAHYSAAMLRFPQGRLLDDCRYGMGRALQEQGQTERALKLFNELAAADGSTWADDAQFQIGTIRYAAGEYDAADEAFAGLIARWPESNLREKATIGSGWALFHLTRYDAAAPRFEALAGSDEFGVEARYWLALVHKAQQQYRKAAETLSDVAEEHPHHELAPAARYHAGDSLLRDDQAQEALTAFDAVLQNGAAHDWHDKALLGKLQAALALGDHAAVDAAAEQFAADYAESELRDEAHRVTARSLLQRKQYDRATALLEPKLEAEIADGDRYLLALAYLGEQRYAEAEATVTPLLKAADADLLPDAQLAYGAALVGQSRFAEALEPLESYRRAKPGGEGIARCRAQLAISYARTGDFDAARRWYRELREHHADDALLGPTTLQVAEAAYAGGERTWSAELFAAVADEPSDDQAAPQALSGLAWSLLKKGQLAEAAAEFERLLARFPQHQLAPEAALARAEILERLEQFDPALSAYRRVIDDYPRCDGVPQAMLSAARIHDRLQQDEDAARLYERLDSEYPDFAERDAVLYEWAWVLRELNRSAEADRQFDRLRQEFPDSPFTPDAIYRLAESAYQVHEYERAAALIAELTGDDDGPLLEYALYLAGQIAAAQQNWSDALDHMQRLIDRFPQGRLTQLARFWTAEALYRQQQYDEAGRRFDMLAEEAAGSTESWVPIVALRRAQVLAQRKHWREALELASGIREEHPGFAQQYEVDYLRGRCLAAQALFEEARQAYRQVTRSAIGGETETAAMAQWMIGESYFHQKNYEAAIREYLRVEVLYAYPNWQAAALLQAGKCYEQKDEYPSAAELYQRLVDDFSDTSFADEARQRLRVARSKGGRTKQ